MGWGARRGQAIGSAPQACGIVLRQAIVAIMSARLLFVGVPAHADDPPRCDRFRATIVGTAAADVIRGTTESDVIHALAGDDRVWGLGGDDLLCGGSGGDRLYGGPSNDKVIAGVGDDRAHGGRGDDFVDVADLVGGNDFVSGEGGDDHCALDAWGAGDEMEVDACESAASGVVWPR
jgi:Ca2+-binding RTX toxin-like protein